MGLISPPAPPPCQDPEGCCLELHETLVVLVALILLVQVALKLLTLIYCYLCQLLHSFCAMIIAKECQRSRPPAPAVTRKSHSRKRWGRWSESDVSRQKRCPRCVHCTLEPLKLTMNVQNEDKEPRRAGRRPYADYPPCEYCECEHHHPANPPPTAPAVVRYRDVACGTSETMFYPGSNERRNTIGPATEMQYQDVEYPAGAGTRTRRPTKVYIYPVHPQTPPGSRAASPERAYRRRGTVTEEGPEYEVREQRRRSPRESTAPVTASPGLTRFQNLAASVAAQTEGAGAKSKTTPAWPDLTGGSDWVYRPLK
ncbi:uncharacterized protein LOC134292414 [Anolis carolinensis]|uniref:uncharacterized protein LOC134292414 n=1 Tax=Anolis carolinensis TaxID=28377 RepID=UPI002F2B8808